MNVPDIAAPSSDFRPDNNPFGFAQGYVMAWDAIAGTNKIRIRGTEFDNLLSLVGSEVGLIRVGDTVGVLRYLNTWAVLGRVEPPGVEQRALGIHYAFETGVDDTASSVFEDRNGPEVSVYIGSSRRCRVSLSMEALVENNLEYMSFRVTGASTIAPQVWRSLTVGGPEIYIQATREVILTAADGLNEGLNVFKSMHRTSIWPGDMPLLAEVQLIVQPF